MIGRVSARRNTSTKLALRNAAGKGPRIGHTALPWLDRIAFDDLRAALMRVFDRGFQQGNRDTLMPKRSGDEKARHRPHWLIIDALQRGRAIQNGVSVTRRHRTPADRLPVGIGEDAGFLAGSDDLLERSLVAWACLLGEL